jgi:hypothetical protein
MTNYDYNYDFQSREVGDEIVVTNNLGRTALHKEIVYLGGVLGVVEEFAGILNGAAGRISPLSPNVEITTAQIEATDTFTAGNILHFLSGGSSAAGKLIDTPEAGSVPVGKITAEQGTGGAQTAVSFRAFTQEIEAAPGRMVKMVKTVISADKTGGVVVDIPLGAEIVDMTVIGTAASSGGTVTLKDGAGSPNTLATALAMAAVGTVARLAAGVVTGSLVVGSTGIKLFSGQAADRGIVYIYYV